MGWSTSATWAADKFIKDPKEAVSVQQKVKVTVVEVDVERKRIGLSMKANPFADQVPQQKSATKTRPTGGTGRRANQMQILHLPNVILNQLNQRKELSMEEKLALLKEKFKK
jgi:uncharacterized protein